MESKEKEKVVRKKKSVLARVGKVLAWIIGSVIFLILLVLILIQTAPVQNFARKKIVSYLENKLKTKVEIGKLRIKFPTAISLQNIYLEDKSKDTLLYGGELLVDISMLKLLKSEVNIQEIELNNIVAKVKRLPPDTTFNFQFIIDAFAGSSSTSTKKDQDTSSLKINIDRIAINNTRVIFKDVITGNDMDLAIGNFDTRISTFDPAHMLFDIPKINLKGLKGHFYQLQPLQQPISKTVAETASQQQTYLKFINKEINLSDIDVDYKSESSALSTSLVVGNLVVHPKSFDLKNGIYSINDIALGSADIAVEMDSKKVVNAANDTSAIASSQPFKFILGNITIDKTSLKYDDKSAPHVTNGMDYSHLNITDLALNVNNIEYSSDKTVASVKSASFKEQSGFVLNNFTTDFTMTPNGISLQNLDVATPNSEIKKSAVITYPSLASIQKNPSLMALDINIENTKIAIKDIELIAPQLKQQLASLPSNDALYADARITGKVNDLTFQKLILRGLTATDINVTGTIKGLPDPKKINADLIINKFQSSKTDILSLIPKGSLPSNITLPESLAASGTIKGGMQNVFTNLVINTSLGSATINGTLVNITDQYKAKYDVVLNAKNLQLGTLMQNPQLGSLTGNFKVNGSGLKPDIANATFSATIPSVTLNKYNYTNIEADGNIANKVYKLNASIHDPNLSAQLNGGGSYSGKFPAIQVKATIDSIKTLPLHLTSNSITYHGDIDADFTSTDPDNLAGRVAITHSILVNDSQRVKIDSLKLIADNSNNTHSLSLSADFLSASIKGQYKLTQIADVFQQAIDPYFAISTSKSKVKVSPYNFTITAGVIDNAALHAFLPALKKLKPVSLNGNFSNESGWNMSLQAPLIIYADNVIDSVNGRLNTQSDHIAFDLSFKHIASGTSISVYATSLVGTLQNNNVDFTLNIKDKKYVNKYTLSGLLKQPAANEYTFSLKPNDLLLNYNNWSVAADNSIQYQNKDILAHNFVLTQGSQELGLNTIGNAGNSQLQIEFKNFRIETITAFVQQDSLSVNGLINGNALVKNIQTQPTFTTDITVNDLSVYQDTVGTLTAKVNNSVANTYNAIISLKGNGNEVNINGDYIVKTDNSSYNFVLDVAALQMKSVEGFTKGGIKDARGFIYGKINVNGTLKKPNVDGKINFDNTAFNVTAFNTVFRIDKEAIAVINNKGIELNSFTIRDTANNPLTIDGAVNTSDFLNYSFNLGITADNFQVLNSTIKDNKVFYGKMIFSTKLTIKGTPTHPIVDGSLSINDKTNFTIVLPEEDPQVSSREGIVRFVDYSATKEDSLLMAPYDSLNTSSLVGYDVSINVTISKEASFNVIVDAANGDFLKLKGTAQLTAGIDASGKITLVGSYEIEEGSYQFAINLLKRQFNIQKGSRIVWTGEPTSAQMDVTAIYIANTDPLDLVQGQTVGDQTIYKQKLPFEVHLKLEGELLKPQITFDIILPSDKNYNVSNDIVSTVQNKLVQVRQDPGEMNKQVFALLLLGRFVGQNPFESNGGSVDAGTLAMQSVSRLLSEQLNALTQNLIAGVDINFDLATTQDYTTGTQQNRTDLNVGVSKRLLNDRLTVTVGSDFELQGPQPATNPQQNFAGNISINYKLSKDGKYMLRAYRKNDYTDVLEGYVIETGVGFIISVDYNKFKELFTTKEQRRKKREIKKDNKKITKEDETKQQNQQPFSVPTKAG